MKRRMKIGLALAATGLGVVMVSSCTASFCSVSDLARMKYAFEPGITRIEKSEDASDFLLFKSETNTYKITGAKLVLAQWVPSGDDPHIGNFIFHNESETEKKELNYLNDIIKTNRDAGVKQLMVTPSNT